MKQFPRRKKCVKRESPLSDTREKMADEALTKAVDTLTSQLQEKNDTLLELQSQLSQREAYIAQLHRVIIANGGAVPGPQVSAQASSPSTNGEVKEGLSKSQKKRQRRQQKQQIEAKVTPLQEQAAATPSESTTAEPSATPKKNVESGSGAASKKRKRTQGGTAPSSIWQIFPPPKISPESKF